jgi:hypothetical protein
LLKMTLQCGDYVAVPALGQTNFLLFVFGCFFILVSSAVLLFFLDSRFMMFLPSTSFGVF